MFVHRPADPHVLTSEKHAPTAPAGRSGPPDDSLSGPFLREALLTQYGKSSIMPSEELHELFWVGSSLDDLREFPEDVQDVIGYALHIAQSGGKHPSAKPLGGDPAFRSSLPD